MTELLSLRGLCKSYPDGHKKALKILTDLNQGFLTGQSYSVVGRSGSGKSTLLHLLGGLDHPTSGQVLFEGKELLSFSPDQLASWRSRNLGFVFQAHHLLPDFSALENALIPALLLGHSQKDSKVMAEALLVRLGLEERLHHRPATLSGGEQQRVAIARALVNQPQLVLADEPTGNLDPQTGKMVSDLLAEICAAEKMTLILVTHSPELAGQMDHRLRLELGTLSVAEA